MLTGCTRASASCEQHPTQGKGRQQQPTVTLVPAAECSAPVLQPNLTVLGVIRRLCGSAQMFGCCSAVPADLGLQSELTLRLAAQMPSDAAVLIAYWLVEPAFASYPAVYNQSPQQLPKYK